MIRKTLTKAQIYANGEKMFNEVMKKPNRIILDYVRKQIVNEAAKPKSKGKAK